MPENVPPPGDDDNADVVPLFPGAGHDPSASATADRPEDASDIEAELAAAYLEDGFEDGFEDEDDWLEAWDAADREAGAFLREHLAEHRHAAQPTGLDLAGAALRDALRTGDPDAAWMRRAAGVAEDLRWPGGGPIADEDLVYDLVATTIALPEDPGLPAEDQASLMTLEHVDWLGAIVELVRRGPGTPADADALARYTSTCPEIEGDPVDPDDLPVLAAGFEVARRGWRVAGVVDRDDQLTDVGAWLLPRAACFAWDTDFDHPDDDGRMGEDGPWADGAGPGGDDDALLDELAELHGLDERGVGSLSLLLTIHQGALLGAGDVLDDATVRDAATEALAEPGVAGAFATEALGIGRQTEDADALERVAETVLEHARGRDAAPAHYLFARVAEIRGDVAAGQAALDHALRLDLDLEPALDDAAWYAEDRGDHRGVVRLLRRLGVDRDDPQLVRMEELAAAAAPPSGVGRNDPCPCGSGRKFKACCLRSPGPPIADRLPFVLAKLDTYLQRPAQRIHLLGLALAAGGGDEETTVARLRDPMTFRLAGFDQGLIADWLRERGPLLPADERALVEGWLEVRVGAFEVVDVTPGEGLTLLDLRSGERTAVRERTGSRTLQPGTTLLTHLLPVGAGWQLGTAMTIPEEQRASLVDLLSGDPAVDAIAAWLGDAARPPALVTPEGDPLETVELRLRVPDPAAASAWLEERYEDDGNGTYIVVATEGRSIEATIGLDGDHLDASTTSWPRAERIRDAILEALPGSEVVRTERRDLQELLTERRSGEVSGAPGVAGADGGVPGVDGTGGGALDPTALPPEALEAVAGLMREMEEGWLDEAIPMFGGATPREAVADPTRRDQVQRFLDQMEREAGTSGPAVGMDAARLKRLLGLDEPT